MTTVPAVIFLYTAQTEVSAVTIVRWINGGKIPSAAALSVVIFVTSAAVWMLQALLMRRLVRRTQAWQNSGRT
jgi:iron(III) transport system permease protein